MPKVVYLFSILIVLFSCKNTPSKNQTQVKNPLVKIEGKTMGTTYHVTYIDSLTRNLKAEIDQLLLEVNNDVSTYEKDAFITRFNKADKSLLSPQSKDEGIHFSKNYYKAKEVYKNTNGHFDPTVTPLVNYWGFGYTGHKPITSVDSAKVDSLKQYIGFDKIDVKNDRKKILFVKENKGVQLDFGAIAKGYGVDAVGELLEANNIRNYLVEIGGEVRARGKNKDQRWWTLGINIPKEDAGLTDFKDLVQVKNSALATSGNYRNFYEVEGVKYSHTINPRTGFPERNPLLSASVFAKDCMTADAYATAFMVMGLDKAYELALANEELEAYFIYSSDNGEMKIKYTTGVEDLIKK